MDLKRIIETIEAEIGVKLDFDCRKRKYVVGRNLYYHFALKYTNESLESISGLVNRDHSTICHYKKKREEMESQKLFKQYFEVLNLPIAEFFDAKVANKIKKSNRLLDHLQRQNELLSEKNRILMLDYKFKSDIDKMLTGIPKERIEMLKQNQISAFVKLERSRKTYDNTTREERG